MMGAIPQANGGQKFLGALSGENIDSAGQQKGEENVFLDREGRKEMKKLKHEPDFEAAEGGEFGIIQGVEGVAFEVGLPCGGGVESSEDMEKGAFTASTGTGDGDDLRREDFEGYPSEGVNMGIP